VAVPRNTVMRDTTVVLSHEDVLDGCWTPACYRSIL